jgi:elongation factor P hydroxylase
MNDDALIDCFHSCFFLEYHTCLRGGFDEPLYVPCRGEKPAEIRFRRDYVSSALHEVAHWCIAGKKRRLLQDFGYWYEPDGRNPQQQQAFVQVEAKPQAIEWWFHQAIGRRFHLSFDNLSGESIDPMPFAQAVVAQALDYSVNGLPLRADKYVVALSRQCGSVDQIQSFEPSLHMLIPDD